MNFFSLQRLGDAGKAAILAAFFSSMIYGQTKDSATTKSVLQQHYDAAQSYQSSGNLNEAARQYRIFVADALGEMAIERARIGDYDKAAPFFDEALRLAPNSPVLEIEYAQAALAHGDVSRARSLAEQVTRKYPENAKANAKAHLVLGRALMRSGQTKEARQQFEAAVALEPDFEDGYALATACLDMEDKPCSIKVFSEMQTAFGDTAVIHKVFGLAYGNSDFRQDAIVELQKAIAEDPHIPGAHYALAAVYLASSEGAKTAEAEEELRKELKNSPNDSLTYAALGHIEQSEHKNADAERDLKRAIELDSENSDAYFYLGQLYFETNRPTDAEATLRKSIALTRDVSHNRYQVQKAHYMLGRILMQAGHADEAHREMQISAGLTKQSLAQDRNRLADYLDMPLGMDTNSAVSSGAKPDASINAATAKQSQVIDGFEKQLAPALADSYNNLGAISAGDKDFANALTYFHRAAEWNPSLEGLDYNWGRAAFSANQFQDAIAPLERALRLHAEDTNVRSMLGLSQYMTADYAGALKTLQPMEAQLNNPSQLAFVYAASMVKAGNFNDGLNRLLDLEKANPGIPEVHRALAAAYKGASRPDDAEREAKEYETLRSQQPGAQNPH
ncbi:MAG TPA: tetratricopeptide repeat protein [Pseudacidobacterium sp.]|jgi:tetratricopeptide (TPR) repeat protein|nr:tetratricopeptide repeat protein [Pseudacidobacterium sp.]